MTAPALSMLYACWSVRATASKSLNVMSLKAGKKLGSAPAAPVVSITPYAIESPVHRLEAGSDGSGDSNASWMVCPVLLFVIVLCNNPLFVSRHS